MRLISICVFVVGICLVIVSEWERALYMPLSRQRLDSGQTVWTFSFTPRLSEEYDVWLWTDHTGTPLEYVERRLNAAVFSGEKHPEEWIDLSWQILEGDRIVVDASIKDVHGVAVGYQAVAPIWHAFRLEGGRDYRLRVVGPNTTSEFYQWKPTILIYIGDDYHQNGVPLYRLLKPVAWAITIIGFLAFGAGFVARKRKTAEPGATDNPDDAQ